MSMCSSAATSHISKCRCNEYHPEVGEQKFWTPRRFNILQKHSDRGNNCKLYEDHAFHTVEKYLQYDAKVILKTVPMHLHNTVRLILKYYFFWLFSFADLITLKFFLCLINKGA